MLLAAAGLAGLITVPDAAPLWMVVFGVGIGGTFPLALMLMVTRSTDPRETERISSAAQTLGYTFAIVGPVAVGELHALAGSWTTPLVLMAATMLVPDDDRRPCGCPRPAPFRAPAPQTPGR